MRPLLEDCAAVPCSMEPLLGPLVARASAGVFLPSPFSYRGGAHACALPWEELCCSDQQRGTLFGHLLEPRQGSCLTKVLAFNGPLS